MLFPEVIIIHTNTQDPNYKLPDPNFPPVLVCVIIVDAMLSDTVTLFPDSL